MDSSVLVTCGDGGGGEGLLACGGISATETVKATIFVVMPSSLASLEVLTGVDCLQLPDQITLILAQFQNYNKFDG